MSRKLRIGVIGCGAISGKYLVTSRKFPILDIVACADINGAAAEQKAAEFGIPKVLSVKQLLADPAIDIVLNLTVPKAHASISLQALKAGKYVYTEKPLAVTRADGEAILRLAHEKKLLVGGAPDTFLGAGLQTARKVIDDGKIGKPVAFTAFMMCPGHEHWHPSPEFYYEVGGGPMLDMGPYYVTALLNLLGPVKRLCGLSSVAIGERKILSQPKFGKKIVVETPDHITGSMEFEDGAVGTLITSFATRFASYDGEHPITIFGTEGTLQVPDPNCFDGTVLLRRNHQKEFQIVRPVFKTQFERSVGLADMAQAIVDHRPPRAGAEQLMAALDIMLGFLDSSRSGKVYKPTTAYLRPAPMHLGRIRS